MKVYFSGARAGREKYGQIYEDIKVWLKKEGYQVIDNGRINPPTNYYFGLTNSQKSDMYQLMIRNIESTDFSIFEASFPSTLHIGHEITVAVNKGKPVIVLYYEKREPIMFHGIKSDRIIWVEYNEKNLLEKLEKSLVNAKKKVDVKFNFFIPRTLMIYLDWVTKEVGLNKSEYIRMLIEKEVSQK